MRDHAVRYRRNVLFAADVLQAAARASCSYLPIVFYLLLPGRAGIFELVQYKFSLQPQNTKLVHTSQYAFAKKQCSTPIFGTAHKLPTLKFSRKDGILKSNV